MKLGVFDSGIGGEAVAQSLRAALPALEIMVVNDKAHMPYGSRPSAEVVALTNAAIQPLLQAGCACIVIACKTATTIALPILRKRYPTCKFIGIEPMVKPAANITKSSIIAVCATPSTLASERYHKLILQYAQGKTIIEPDCSNWAYMIENNAVNADMIYNQISTVINEGADVIVLGCTHYHWIKDLIEKVAGNKAVVLEPSAAIARRVKDLLQIS